MPMVKLLMAKGYKLEISIPLEKTTKIEDSASVAAQIAAQTSKKNDGKKVSKSGKPGSKSGS